MSKNKQSQSHHQEIPLPHDDVIPKQRRQQSIGFMCYNCGSLTTPNFFGSLFTGTRRLFVHLLLLTPFRRWLHPDLEFSWDSSPDRGPEDVMRAFRGTLIVFCIALAATQVDC